MGERALHIEGLRVLLPSGDPLIDGLDLELFPGEVVVILGGSGAGKSTLSKVLFERESLERAGFEIVAETLDHQPAELGLVPQRGALFDHLDVAGNLELAIRYASSDDGHAPAGWLERVGLSSELARPGVAVGQLSGGQAQRVAVARALAGRRRVLFLDEPSVGLDPHRVRMLARLIREQADNHGIAAVVVTHDVALAGGVADRILVLSTQTRTLEPLYPNAWPGPLESQPQAERERWLVKLERDLVSRLAEAPEVPRRRRAARSLYHRIATRLSPLLAPFEVAATSLARLPAQAINRPRDFLSIGSRVLGQTLLRPLPFFAIVSVLIGYTVVYVTSKVGGIGVRPDILLRQMGGAYVVALAPALSAILYVAASGSAANAWLGSMGLTRQTLALRALGVDTHSYLVAPTWVAVAVGYFGTAVIFTVGMMIGGTVVTAQLGMDGGWSLIAGDLIDPRPERWRYTMRALFLFWIYGWGIASDIVAQGSAPKAEADDVTRAMTRSVVTCTLWIVAWELCSVLVAV